MHKKTYHHLLIVGLFTAVSLTWGTTWMAMKIAVSAVPPIFATGLRFLCSAPLLLLLARYKKVPLLFPSGQWSFQVYVTLFYFALPFTLMIYGERYTSSSLASIIFATMPAIILILSLLVLRERTSIQQILGLGMSISALSIILWHEMHHTTGTNQLRGMVALLVAVCMHGIMYVQCKKRCVGMSVLSYNALPSLGAGTLLTFAGLCESPHLQNFTLQALLAIIYLGIIAGVGGVLAYFSLQQITKPFQASMVFMIFPLIAVILERIINGSCMMSSYSLMLLAPFLLGMVLILYRIPPQLDRKPIRAIFKNLIPK
ncbi:EamA-like transporter family protein [Candidatus Erwinia haradaeae]|uniref:EamA-like transporter family protein n=1 Tax=Candidatus Erwinia haradaeae TaxID=1922217 RepID=A0A451DDH3_9GAMM|nr:DMT family transporter [Candidatus Erwinia haradaeae]VFP84468.1 EamA-like transporter family protein [Candidatus Erwinia haradaeae]